MTIKQLTKKDLTISIVALEEIISIHDDEFLTSKQKKDISKRLDYNIWAWCCVKVECTYYSLTATSYLGCCSYQDEQDFIKNSGYYEDMINDCLIDLQGQLSTLIAESVSF